MSIGQAIQRNVDREILGRRIRELEAENKFKVTLAINLSPDGSLTEVKTEIKIPSPDLKDACKDSVTESDSAGELFSADERRRAKRWAILSRDFAEIYAILDRLFPIQEDWKPGYAIKFRKFAA